MRELLWSPRQPAPDQVAAVALYLHGGAVRSRLPVTRAALTVQRSRLMRDAIAPALAANGIASVLLKHGVAGWNASRGEPAPVGDAGWALEEIRRRHDVPVVLIGHSMGARTGLRVAAHPNVVGLVALAPWFPADEDVDSLLGRHLTILHGTRDRVTSPRDSRAVAARAETVATATEYIPMPGLGHYLITDAAGWHRGTRDAVRRIVQSLEAPA